MGFNWIPYTAELARQIQQGFPSVSITDRGSIMINASACTDYGIKTPVMFMFFTDMDRKIVGMKNCENGTHKGYNPNGSSVIRVSNLPVLRSIGFDLSSTVKRRLHRDEETGYLYFCLNEPKEDNG